ncbi:MAG: hypothetical protein ACXAD7_17105 [Candidatus Kariarchaeaceae archaeon]
MDTTAHRSLKEQYTHTTQLPRRRANFLVWFLALSVGTLLSAGNLAAAAIIFLLGGAISARIWRKVGWSLTYRAYIVPLLKMQEDQEDTQIQSRFLRYVFGTNIMKIFLQLETPDRDISSLRKLLKETVRIFISFFAITVTVARLIFMLIEAGDDTVEFLDGNKLSDPAIGSLLIGLLVAFPALSLYLPQALITKDARVMVVHADGSIKYAGGRIRDTLDGLFGVTGLLSGFDLLRSEDISIFQSVFLFIGILLFGTILASPALFPAVLLYFRKHSQLVNKFRDEAVKADIYPARTTALPLVSEELKELGIDEDRGPSEIEPKNILGKIDRFILGPKLMDPLALIKQEDSLSSDDQWACEECHFINQSRDQVVCQQCGNKRDDLA